MTPENIEETLERFSAALAKLGIAFCPECETPHNTRSQLESDLDGYLNITTKKGDFVHICAGCAVAWLKKSRRKVADQKLGSALSSWILDQRVYESTHTQHEQAVALCEAFDIRFDLLLWRRAKAAAGVLHGQTEGRLLESLAYRWDLESRQINAQVLDYIDHVRAGGKVCAEAWPPEMLEQAA